MLAVLVLVLLKSQFSEGLATWQCQGKDGLSLKVLQSNASLS